MDYQKDDIFLTSAEVKKAIYEAQQQVAEGKTISHEELQNELKTLFDI